MRWDIINRVISTIGATSYLEIGVLYGDTWRRIKCDYKVGIDPIITNEMIGEKDIHETTSDQFFSWNQEYFDVIFIDGLHKYEQVQQDLENSLKFLNDDGAIILHDTMPPDARYATEKPTLISKSGNPLWCGDAWRIFSWLCKQSDLNYWTIDEDYGCTVVLKRPKTDRGMHIDNWTYYFPNRLKVGRVVTLNRLIEILNDATRFI